MIGTSSFPMLAEIDPARIARLQQDLTEQVGLIAWIYGSIIVLGLLLDAAILIYWRTRSISWRERLGHLVWRPWSSREIIILAIFLGALQMTVAWLVDSIDAFSIQNGLRPESVLLIIETLILHVAGLAMVWALVRQNRVSWSSAFGVNLPQSGRRILQGIMFLLATMPPLLFYTFVYQLVLQYAGLDTAPQDVLFAISDETALPMRIFFVVLAAVLAPLFEEVFFRGILLPVLAKRMRIGVAVTIVSCVFALVHWNVASFVPLFLLSVSFCLVYIYTESLLAPIVMHSLFNLVTISLLLSAQ